MIRINLLGVERQPARKAAAAWLDASQRTTFVCCLIFGFAALGIGGWYWQLTTEAARLTTEIAAAQQETTRLQAVLAEVARAEERRKELEHRVQIIEELRRGQAVPVQLLDHISKSVPDLLWLTALDQKPDAVSIEGRTTTLISLADFVGNLGGHTLVSKPIDIVNSEVEAGDGRQGGDVIRFAVKAPLVQKSAPAAAAAPARGGGAGAVPPAAAR